MADVPIKISAVMQICQAINDAGRSDDFVSQMRAAGAFVKVDAKMIVLVKQYFDKNGLAATPFGATVMQDCPDPYQCSAVETTIPEQ